MPHLRAHVQNEITMVDSPRRPTGTVTEVVLRLRVCVSIGMIVDDQDEDTDAD